MQKLIASIANMVMVMDMGMDSFRLMAMGMAMDMAMVRALVMALVMVMVTARLRCVVITILVTMHIIHMLFKAIMEDMEDN